MDLKISYRAVMLLPPVGEWVMILVLVLLFDVHLIINKTFQKKKSLCMNTLTFLVSLPLWPAPSSSRWPSDPSSPLPFLPVHFLQEHQTPQQLVNNHINNQPLEVYLSYIWLILVYESPDVARLPIKRTNTIIPLVNSMLDYQRTKSCKQNLSKSR